ncbi:MAG: hypothetical protein BMS9Abin06_1226 [Gammaproteobacteria bacterium]|nr:MAG: hypothetical protein BMS9Abin06_1226 [Gammaproteobacteria bacterium]
MSRYKVPPPKIIEIETSSLCNLKCVMCPQSIKGGVPRPNRLPERLAEKIVPYINSNTECVSLHGIGEPFLSKSFWNLLPHIPEKCHAQANTNLTVLTDKMLSSIISSNLNLLNVSLDGPDEELYKKIRGFDLSIVLSNISKIITARERAGNRHLKVYGNMTLMKCNIDRIIGLYPKFATHDHYLWSVYIVFSSVFILYEISMECAQEYPHPPRSGKSCRRMNPMYGIRWLCS